MENKAEDNLLSEKDIAQKIFKEKISQLCESTEYRSLYSDRRCKTCYGRGVFSLEVGQLDDKNKPLPLTKKNNTQTIQLCHCVLRALKKELGL